MTAPRRRWRVLPAAALVAAAATAGLVLEVSAGPHTLPRPAPDGRAAGFDAAAENARCEGCHQEIAAEWRASGHRNASTDPVYRRQLAREPLTFCRGCHAPESDPTGPTDAVGDALGVGCVTCHVPDGTVLAAPVPAAGTPETPPHPVTRRADFAGVGACATCHEFSFPDRQRRAGPLLMQSTVTEHRASPFASVPCAGCHMDVVGEGTRRHRDHGFGSSRDPGALAAAVRATATRTSAMTVRIRLEPRAVGHAFPTGDMFRRIEVSAEAVGVDHQSLASAERHLARHFRRAEGVDGRPIKVLAADDRIGPGAADVRTVDLDLGAAARGVPVAWRVAYQRVESLDEGDPSRVVVEGEVVLAQGTLAP